MTIRDLIDALEEAAADLGDDAPVRLATQPSYPLAAHISAVTETDDRPGVLWIASTETVPSDESPYAPRSAWDRTYG